MSTIAPLGVSTVPCSRSSPRANGSTPTTIWPRLARPASARAGWPAPSARACRDNRSVLYHRWPKLCEDLALARGDGRHPRLIKSFGRADPLILDDFGLEPLDAGARHDLLEILEERYGRRSTVVTSQLPPSAWHEVIGDPTYADAILDRLVHNAHRIELTGDSLRRTRGKQSKGAIIPLQTGGFIGIGRPKPSWPEFLYVALHRLETRLRGAAAPAARCGSGQWRRVGSPLCRSARRLFRSRWFRAVAHRLE